MLGLTFGVMLTAWSNTKQHRSGWMQCSPSLLFPRNTQLPVKNTMLSYILDQPLDDYVPTLCEILRPCVCKIRRMSGYSKAYTTSVLTSRKVSKLRAHITNITKARAFICRDFRCVYDIWHTLR